MYKNSVSVILKVTVEHSFKSVLLLEFGGGHTSVAVAKNFTAIAMLKILYIVARTCRNPGKWVAKGLHRCENSCQWSFDSVLTLI